jgi:DNA-binding PadR family transcriptional regulator
MSSPSGHLRPISYAVLAMVGQRGGSGPELAEGAGRAAELFWAGGASQMYAELRRLTRLGYLSERREPAKTRPRTVYHLTATGRRAIGRWLAEPSRYPRVQHEAGLRVAAADLGDERAVVASLRALRDDLPRLEGLVGEIEARAAMFPHRARYLRLEMSLARKMIRAHREWVDEVERELGEPHADGQ